ncbi:MAG: hypothetical protein ABH847_02105 [Candidatus Omnitrophota bacterium]
MIRGKKVMLDKDLVTLYGIETKSELERKIERHDEEIQAIFERV